MYGLPATRNSGFSRSQAVLLLFNLPTNTFKESDLMPIIYVTYLNTIVSGTVG